MRGDLWIFHFCAAYSTQSCQNGDCRYFWNFDKLWIAIKSKIRSDQVFWTMERYLWENFHVKWSRGEWGVAFWRSFFSISWSKHYFVWFLCHILLRRQIFKCLQNRIRRELESQWALFETRKDRPITYVKMKEKEEIRFYPPPP